MSEPATGVFLFGARHVLFALHTAGSLALLVASTYHLVLARRFFRPEGLRWARRLRLCARVIAVAYPLTFALGALLYPTYRVHVRALFLDAHAPSVAHLFDVKEALAALTLVLAPGLALIARELEPEADRELARIYVAMSVVVALTVWFSALVGLLVTSVRSVM